MIHKRIVITDAMRRKLRPHAIELFETKNELSATQERIEQLERALTNIVNNVEMGDLIMTVVANGEDDPEHPFDLDPIRAILKGA